MEHASPRTHPGVWLALVVMEVIWGVHFVVAKMALQSFPPTALAAIRVTFASAALMAFAAATGALRRLTRRDVRDALVLGLSGVAANQLFWIIGLGWTSPSHSALIVSTIPIGVLLLAALFLREPITRWRAAGAVLAIAGVATLMFAAPAAPHPGGSAEPSLRGDLFTLGTVIAWSVYTLSGKKVVDRAGAAGVTAIAHLTGVVLLVPIGLPALAAMKWSAVPASGWLGVGYVSLLSSAVAYLLYFWGLGRLGAGRVALLAYLQPPIAALVSVLFLHEQPTLALGAGAAAVLAGLAIAQRAPVREA